MGLYVWHRETPFGPERTRLCCPRKTTLPASEKSESHPRWQPATAGSLPRSDLREQEPVRAVSMVSGRRCVMRQQTIWLHVLCRAIAPAYHITLAHHLGQCPLPQCPGGRRGPPTPESERTAVCLVAPECHSLDT